MSLYSAHRLVRVDILRCAAYLLAFCSGAAAMFAFSPSRVKPELPGQDAVPSVEAIARVEFIRSPKSEPGELEAPAVASEVAPASESIRSEGPVAEQRTDEVAVAIEATHSLCMAGVTEPAYGRYAKLPLATSQAIAFVDVKPGDRIKKGWQVFSHWESPERLQAMKTELEKTKKILDVAKIRAAAAKQTIDRLQKIQTSVSAQQLQDAETMSTIRQGELETAELAVAEMESRFNAMEFEFNQAFVTSPIDGVVASVDVIPGERRQAGTGFRGVTVIDARVLHCRCMIDQKQIALLERIADQALTQMVAAQSITSA